ncbi:MAG: hypothetical protein ACOC33_01965 [bacterium]
MANTSEAPETNASNTTEEVPSTPFTVSSFNSINGDNKILAEISPAKFDSLVKILSLLDKSQDAIIIQNSSIIQQYKRGILHADIKEIFDEKEVNLQILNPKKNIKLLKQFKNNNNIYIIDDDENSRYVLTNGEIKLFLPKQSSDSLKSVQMPDYSGSSAVCNATLDKDSSRTVDGLAADSNYIEYLIQDDNLKAIHVPDTAIYVLNDYIQDPQASKLDETNADLTLRTEVYLPVVADEYKIQIGKLPDETYFSYTVCDTGLIKMNVFENLDLTTGGNLLL